MEDLTARFFGNLADRVGGPLTFRLIIQPLVAIFLATRAGLADARAGRPIYGWSVLTDSVHRSALLREGWKSIAKVFVAAIVIDCVYQIVVMRWIYPGEALLVGATLAMLPYLLVRGPVNRIARRFLPGDKREPHEPTTPDTTTGTEIKDRFDDKPR